MGSLLYLLIGYLVGVIVVGAIASVKLCEEQAKTRKWMDLYNEQRRGLWLINSSGVTDGVL